MRSSSPQAAPRTSLAHSHPPGLDESALNFNCPALGNETARCAATAAPRVTIHDEARCRYPPPPPIVEIVSGTMGALFGLALCALCCAWYAAHPISGPLARPLHGT